MFPHGVLVLLGLAVFGGLIGAWIFQKIRFPQVVGYIVIGLLLGQSGFALVSADDIENLKMLNLFALGIIGFLVGGELKLSIFRKYARQFTAILLLEGVLAFLLVGISIGLVTWFLVHNFAAALATGIIFGAIASATDPASTIDVIWEYRAKGVMTTAIIAIVALDDALAMTLYGLGTGTAQLLTSEKGSILHSLIQVGVSLGGAILIGAVAAGILTLFLRHLAQPERAVALSVGVILLVIGMAATYQLDVILSTMMIGFVLVNLAPRRSEDIFKLLRSFSVPIYVLFFVLVGARLEVGNMPLWLWAVVVLYVAGRSIGKIVGAYYGSKWTHGPPEVSRNLGMGLFAQGGVAIGLSIVAAEYLGDIRLSDRLLLSDMVIYVVTTTTLILQLIGPAMVKFAVKRSGEAGRNLTEEDVMAQLTVADVLGGAQPPPIREGDSVEEAVAYFTEHDLLISPVVDSDNRIRGILTFDALKNVLSDRDAWRWLLVADLMTPMFESATPGERLPEVYQRMQQFKLDQLPVVDAATHQLPIGVIDLRAIRSRVNAELLRISEKNVA